MKKRQRLGDQNSEQETLEQLAQEVKDAKSKELKCSKEHCWKSK
ncbi:hypothetical protein [Holzapfeliella floricola]|nr:hypothetical protein [Holzapfeliella floricola]